MITNHIFLSWRPGPGERRFIVGRFDRHQHQTISFHYLTEAIRNATLKGFSPYPAFQDIEKVYQDVLDTVSVRLVSTERSDRVKYLQFWEADNESYDEFDLIGLTQAWLTNDRFEFLAEFIPQPGLTFITDLAAQTYVKAQSEDLEIGDELCFEIETSNLLDSEAVKVLNKTGKKIGYIKCIHNRIFSETVLNSHQIKLSVKSLEMNGALKKVFAKVQLS